MNELSVITHNGIETVDSREVAAMTGKQHKELLRDIRNYAETIEKSNERNFALVDFFIPSTYTDSKGEERPCYLLTKKGCDMVANKMTGEKGVLFTAAYVTAFEKMRQTISQPLTPAQQLLAQASLLVEQEQRISAMETRQDELALKVQHNSDTMDKVTAAYVAPISSGDNWQESVNHTINALVEHFCLNHQMFRRELYEELERESGCDLQQRLTRLKNRMKAAGATVTQCRAVTKLTIISQDKKLRSIFIGILRRRTLEFTAAENA